MSKQQIEKQIAKLEAENRKFNELIRELEKKVKGHLWGWYFLPFFGLIAYQTILIKRKESTGFNNDSVRIKTEILKNDFQIMKLKQELANLKEFDSE